VSVPVRSLVAAVLVLATTASPAAAARASRSRIDPRRTTAAAEVSDRFVSFAVDVDQLVGGTFWDPGGSTNEIRVAPYDFGRPALRTLAGALGAAYLRLGGSASDIRTTGLCEAIEHSTPPRNFR
jgi:hypothetical protein